MPIDNLTMQYINNQFKVLAKQIAQRLSKNPQWVNQNLAVQPAVNRIIAKAISQKDPMLHLSGLTPRELFQSIDFVTKQYTREVIAAAHNTSIEETNKKVFAAKKLTTLMMVLSYAAQSRAVANEKLTKLHQYLTAKAEKEANDEAVASDDTTFIPEPIPQNDLDNFDPNTASNIEIGILLRGLNLKPNATHENIKEAFEAKQTEFLSKPNPTPQEKSEFSECLKCYEKLMLVSSERLQYLSQTLQKELDQNPITEGEVSQFAKTLNLSMDNPVTLREIQEKYLEYGLNNPTAQDQLQKTQETLGKLEIRCLLEGQLSPDHTANATSQCIPQLTRS